MSDMPERIWLEDGNDEYPSFYFDDSVDCTEYVRADLVAEKDAEIATLKADMYRISNEMTAEIERLLALVDSRDDIIQGLHDENAALREGRQTPSEIKTLKDWRDAHAEIERLRKALEQLLDIVDRNYDDCLHYDVTNTDTVCGFFWEDGDQCCFATEAPELYAYLREKEAHV